ncbi:MAG: hypothetical protein AAFY60_16405 [Myxococcota bacterium]
MLALLLLGGCAAEPVWAPEDAVQRALYRHAGGPSITLFTMVNNRTGEGAHAGLMVSASQRVIFDPAGTFWHPTLPERNDVHFGIKPSALDFYIDYHARETYHVVVQTLAVSPEQAERALGLVQSYGAVPKAHCTKAITTVLRQVPGFEGMRSTWFPAKARDAFSSYPNVVTRRVFDDDPDDHSDLPEKTTLN